MAKITWDDRTNSGTDSAVSASIFNDTKTSVNNLYDVIEARLGTTSSATTSPISMVGDVDISGSTRFFGQVIASGSIIPIVAGGETTSSFSLGSATQAWKELYVSNGSINFVDNTGVSSFTKQELDDIQSGKSATTGSKGGLSSGSWSTTQGIFSELDDSTIIRFGDNRIYLSTQNGLMLDITGSTTTLGVSGSTNSHTIYGGITVYGNTPAVTGFGDFAVGTPGGTNGGGIFTFGYAGSGQSTALGHAQTYIYNYDNSISSFLSTGYKSIISGSYGFAQGFETKAGWYSHAEGYQTEAGVIAYDIATVNPLLDRLGQWSHAEGYQSKAETEYSHAEGWNTLTTSSLGGSSAIGAHAEGKDTIARGEGVHAEGRETIAYGPESHTEGYLTETFSPFSHAEGIGTIASASGQHAQGKYNTRGNTTSLMVIGNGVSDGARSDLALFNSDGIEFTANFTASLISASGQLFAGIPEDTDESGTNVVVFNPTTGEFEYTGSFNGEGGNDDDWYITGDDLNVTSSRNVIITGSLMQGNSTNGNQASNYSHAQGRETTATGFNSHAEGYFSIASAQFSHAEGGASTAKGAGSHAEGNTTISSGSYSHAEGRQTLSLGTESHTEGYLTTASGIYSHAEGTSTLASGNASHAEGGYTTSSGNYAHSEGSYAYAEGEASHAEGLFTHASGGFSHAEGQSTLALGRTSHTEGYYTTASGDWGHAEGSNTYARARFSHAEGNLTVTQTDAVSSHAEGIGSQTYGEGAHAEGYYTRASGPWSNAAGSGSQTLHTGSYANGRENITEKDYQTVIGVYNGYGESSGMNKTDEAYFVVGAGISNVARKNAMVINTGSIMLNVQLLPTFDPFVSGQLWRDGTDLKISLG